MAEPGWYDDPWDPTQGRWHDGTNWTGHTVPKTSALPPPPPPSPAPARPPGRASLERDQIVGLIASGAMALGCFLPWARILFITVSGMDGGDGFFFLVGAGILAWASWIKNPALLITFAVLAAALVVFEFIDIGSRLSDADLSINYGAGLYLIVAASIAHFVVGIRMAGERKGR